MTKDGRLYHEAVDELPLHRNQSPKHQQLKEKYGLKDEDITGGGGFNVNDDWTYNITFQSGVANGCEKGGQFTDRELEEQFREAVTREMLKIDKAYRKKNNARPPKPVEIRRAKNKK